VDECTRQAIVEAMIQAGYEMQPWQGLLPAGTPDNRVLHIATKNDWILLTEDKGFGELVFSGKLPASGVVLLRSAVTPDEVQQLTSTLLEALEEAPGLFYHHFTVVEPGRVRRRPVPGSFGNRIRE